MLYVIQNGYCSVVKQSPADIVYCVLRVDSISALDFVFSDGHAFDSLSEFYPKEHIGEIQTIINYDDVYSSYWKSEDTDLKRRKEAECLFIQDIPYEVISGFIVYNEVAKRRVEAMGIEKPIIVRPNYYF